MKSGKLFILCISQNKSLKRYILYKYKKYMITIFMNSENKKTSKPHVLKLELTSKLDLRIGGKVIALSNRSIYYTWRNIKTSYNSNKFKISAPTWNDEFELSDGSYSVSNIQRLFQIRFKKTWGKYL